MSLLSVTELEEMNAQRSRPPTPQQQYLSHLPHRLPVDIEFQDLSFTVPDGRGSKLILRNVSGLFRSGHLTAILGPSGAGKSTLLNILAGYKCIGATGAVLTNGKPRDMRQFRKLSRYIMQEDLLQQRLTVREAMQISANLKLGSSQTNEEKRLAIDEILSMLRLNPAADTMTARLSGGERKRLSIALELVNNPPVIFLDEPTTGLDDLSSSQCVQLLKLLAEGGRTVVCSVHTPSARLFALFNHIYVVASGTCVFQGCGADIVPFIKTTTGLLCPTTYNPADFIIEISSGEYGNHTEAMSAATENGKIYKWRAEHQPVARTTDLQASQQDYEFFSSGFSQFRILLYRMLLQQWRDPVYILIKFLLHVMVGLIVGGMFFGMGNDSSKTLFNVGYCFVCLIALLYIPLLPILLQFPADVEILKREYFNRWHGLSSYFCAFTVSRLPAHIIFTSIYVGISYTMTDQPMDLKRFVMFLMVLLFVGVVSESFGMVIGSVFSVVHCIFMGPSLCVPLMLFAVYGISYGRPIIPLGMKLLMRLSFLRYGLEGLILSIYGDDREPMICPEDEVYCHYRQPRNILLLADMENANFWVDIAALVVMFLVFRVASFILLRWRLSPSSRLAAIQHVARLVKAHLGLTGLGR